MGLAFRRPAFTEEQLQLYQDCTYFSRKEILRLYRRFCYLGAGEVDKTTGDISTRLSFILIQEMPEMRQNPFKVSSSYLFLSPSPLMSNLKMFGNEKRFFSQEQLCEVFSTDGAGLNFEDFLDMFSVLSDNAPLHLKAAYAFRIYDFNGDNIICTDDIKETVKALTGNLPGAMIIFIQRLGCILSKSSITWLKQNNALYFAVIRNKVHEAIVIK